MLADRTRKYVIKSDTRQCRGPPDSAKAHIIGDSRRDRRGDPIATHRPITSEPALSTVEHRLASVVLGTSI
jgi:hypothetical protein